MICTNDPSYVARWENIPGPADALQIMGNGLCNFPWQTQPMGEVEIACTLVDQFDQHTAMSPSSKFTPANWWSLVLNPTGITKETPAVALCYWWNDAGTWRILGAPDFCDNPNDTTRPYWPIAGWLYQIWRGHNIGLLVYSDCNADKYWWPTWDNAAWKKGSLLAPPGAPAVRCYDSPLPTTALKVKYTWACQQGESPASPVLDLPAGNETQNRRSFLELDRRLTPPVGAYGAFVYLSDDDGATWHRQLAPHCVTATKLDDYLYRTDSNILIVHQFRRTGIAPTTEPGRSLLTPFLQLIRGDTHPEYYFGKIAEARTLINALDDSLATENAIKFLLEEKIKDFGVLLNEHQKVNPDICVTEDQIVTCPVINGLINRAGPNMRRTISAPLGGKWLLRASTQPGESHAWPVWAENSQFTRLVGCNIASDTAEAGIAFFDHAGDGAFSFKTERLKISLSAPFSQGIVTTKQSRSYKGHSCSEPRFYDTEIAAKFPIVIEHEQSADWLFDSLEAFSDDSFDSATITLGNSGFVSVKSYFGAAWARALVATVAGSQVDLENVFTDQGFPELFVCAYGAAPTINANFKGLNVRLPFLHCVTQTNPNVNRIAATFTGTASEACNDVCNFTTRYAGIQFTGDPSYVAKHLVARQPDLSDWQLTSHWQAWDHSVTPSQTGTVTVGV